MKIRIRQQFSARYETLKDKRLHPVRQSLRLAACLLAVLGFPFTDISFARAAEPSPTIRVRVTNYTGATPATVSKAEREAGRILGNAGLRTVWLDCSAGQSAVIPNDPCLRPLEPTDIALRVLSDHTRTGFPDSAFGFAVLPVLASVYYEHAMRLAKIDDAEFEIPIILGCIMAHEIGHLLLGSNSHSDTGIMLGQWERKHVRKLMMGDLHFTPQQSRLIRAEGQTRMSLEATELRTPSSLG